MGIWVKGRIQRRKRRGSEDEVLATCVCPHPGRTIEVTVNASIPPLDLVAKSHLTRLGKEWYSFQELITRSLVQVIDQGEEVPGAFCKPLQVRTPKISMAREAPDLASSNIPW